MARALLVFICFIGFSVYGQETYSIKNLKINTENAHFALMPISGGKMMFTSHLLTRKGKVKRIGGNPVLTIFEGELQDNGEIINYKPILIDPDQNIRYITSATISRDGKRLYLTTHYTARDKPEGNFKATNFHIKVGEYKEGVGWTNFKILPFCKPRYSYAHPALSSDGKTLYFIANIRGGKETTKGGSDIFKVEIKSDKIYGEPVNLGSKVNSYSREMFPFISADNTLYFASNRPGGYGGFDIYKSKLKTDGTFEKAVKLTKPMNSVKDDFSLITSDGRSGYFSSKRLKGKGDDDIYYFEIN